MDFKEIQELIKIVGESNLTTVEIENESFRILLKKEYPGFGVQGAVSPIPFVPGGSTGVLPAATAAQATYAGPATPASQTPQASDVRPAQNTIKSPIVGTFYSASSPGAAPFVQPGSKVSKGDTLCIIEAMKLMNEIEAEEDYQILEVLVKDGDMVEYGQALFSVAKE